MTRILPEYRKTLIPKHGRKTGCTAACLAYFGIDKSEFKYSMFTQDVVNILRRKGWSCRSRKSSLKKGCTVGGARKRLSILTHSELVDGAIPIYLIQVKGHVLLLNALGTTVVDTDQRAADRRKIVKIFKVTRMN